MDGFIDLRMKLQNDR